MTAVDIQAAADAYTLLVSDAGLRQRMGESGRGQAVAMFDWKVIIPRYQEVWRHLADIRRHAEERAPRRPGSIGGNPLRPDPLLMFRSYPTRTLAGNTRLARTDGATTAMLMETLSALHADPLNSPARDILSPAADLALAIEALVPPGRTVAETIALVPEDRRLLLVRSLVHLMKFGLIIMVHPQETTSHMSLV
ncbi:hypothetical protein [Azospirillum thermophilum]|uniref:Uncharacterized protein n=1 Tax=Azospirillum thermophilum TaxID=2202148 RepID=A0A2S2D092_9PROT|nr:hypothetical protein [Azospirillum thermophilum]AWK90183.1 hypothetical protein DEW08_29665 [Azospirillum thermophilum]